MITSVKSKRDFICKEESGLHGVRYTKFEPKLEKTSLLLLLLTGLKKISAAAVFKSLINLINLITALWKNFRSFSYERKTEIPGCARAQPAQQEGIHFRFYKLRYCGQDRKNVQPCTFKRFARRLLHRKPCVIFIHQYPRSGKSQHSAGAERGDTFAHVPSGHAAKAHQKRQDFAPAHAFFGSPSTGTVIRKEVFL